MNRIDLILRLVRDVLNCENVSVNATRRVVAASCPLAPWTHKGGRDMRPSFAVFCADDGNIVYNCFACGARGPIYNLLHTLTFLTGEQNSELLDLILEHGVFEQTGTSVFLDGDAWARIAEIFNQNISYQRRPLYFYPDEFIREIPILTEKKNSPDGRLVMEWLVDHRRISPEVISEYELRLFSLDGRRGVVFPVFGPDNKILDLWVRMIDTKQFFRLKRAPNGKSIEFTASNQWFGARPRHLNPSYRTMLVEGALDVLRLRSLGYGNVVASLGFPSAAKLRTIPADTITLAFDSDASGRKMSKFVFERAKNRMVSMFYIDWAFVGIKDPGELESADQLNEALKSVMWVGIFDSDCEKTLSRVGLLEPLDRLFYRIKDGRLSPADTFEARFSFLFSQHDS